MRSSRSPIVVKFDRFELDMARSELLLDGTAVAIQPQPLKALELLVRNAGMLVTREQMQDKLWPDKAAEEKDLERSLNHAVRKLRQALGDKAETPRFVQTVPKRGYRFMGDVDKVWSRPDLRPATQDEPGSQGVVPPREWPDPLIRLRISEFSEVADDRAWPLISAGMVEDLTTRLVGLRDAGLAVLDDSFRAEPSRSEDSPERFFGLKGCVRRSGATVRVNAHLALHPEGSLVATTAFDRELGNVFDLQGFASDRIVEDLILPLLQSAAAESE